MSHVVIIIDRAPSPSSSLEHDAKDACTARVEYHVPHDATDTEVERMFTRLYRQVRRLGMAGGDA